VRLLVVRYRIRQHRQAACATSSNCKQLQIRRHRLCVRWGKIAEIERFKGLLLSIALLGDLKSVGMDERAGSPLQRREQKHDRAPSTPHEAAPSCSRSGVSRSDEARLCRCLGVQQIHPGAVMYRDATAHEACFEAGQDCLKPGTGDYRTGCDRDRR
jgi:hypothetical protein